jgi:hypothetical protein
VIADPLSAGGVHAREISAPEADRSPADVVSSVGAPGTAAAATIEIVNVLDRDSPAEFAAVMATDLVAPPDTLKTVLAIRRDPLTAKSAALVPPDTANV